MIMRYLNINDQWFTTLHPVLRMMKQSLDGHQKVLLPPESDGDAHDIDVQELDSVHEDDEQQMPLKPETLDPAHVEDETLSVLPRRSGRERTQPKGKCQYEDGSVKIEDVLQMITGCSSIPPGGFDSNFTIHFTNAKCYPIIKVHVVSSDIVPTDEPNYKVREITVDVLTDFMKCKEPTRVSYKKTNIILFKLALPVLSPYADEEDTGCKMNPQTDDISCLQNYGVCDGCYNNHCNGRKCMWRIARNPYPGCTKIIYNK
ncbi:G2H3 [Mytilus coruscus]|uniref:G2H3 n=1 Tax=Mytilus coruscus TaxID=42192 RepID=A0A6J7ZUP2_MYTCO|nr:G2H3 [Mytilus coruscus]